MVRSQEKKKEITSYLEANKPHLLGNIRKKGRIRDCCNVLIFRDYLNRSGKETELNAFFFRAPDFLFYRRHFLSCSAVEQRCFSAQPQSHARRVNGSVSAADYRDGTARCRLGNRRRHRHHLGPHPLHRAPALILNGGGDRDVSA